MKLPEFTPSSAALGLSSLLMCLMVTIVLVHEPRTVADAGLQAGPHTQATARNLPLPRNDTWLQCFYDALSSLGGNADGPGYQRTDPACQRR